MRKVLWHCAGATLLAAAVCYLGAEFAYRYPNTLVGRCVVATYHVGVRFNPVYRLGQVAAGKTATVMQRLEHVLTTPATTPAAAPSEAPAIPDDPRPLAVEEREEGPCLAPGHLVGKVVIPPDEEEPAVPVPGVTGDPMTSAAEEAEAIPPTMLPAADTTVTERRMPYADEDTTGEPTRTMPYATDEDDQEGSRKINNLLHETFESRPIEGPDCGHAEESELPAGTPPDCCEDPNYNLHYPGCPHLGPCPDKGKGPVRVPYAPSAGEEQSVPPLPEADPERFLQHKPSDMPRGDRTDYCPAPQKLDTMEFRRSDARPGEFGKFPY
jgi:hypothetical protein